MVVVENDTGREGRPSMRREAEREVRVLADRAAVPVPDGDGPVGTDAALAFDPAEREPLLSVRDGRVVVAGLARA